MCLSEIEFKFCTGCYRQQRPTSSQRPATCSHQTEPHLQHYSWCHGAVGVNSQNTASAALRCEWNWEWRQNIYCFDLGAHSIEPKRTAFGESFINHGERWRRRRRWRWRRWTGRGRNNRVRVRMNCGSDFRATHISTPSTPSRTARVAGCR